MTLFDSVEVIISGAIILWVIYNKIYNNWGELKLFIRFNILVNRGEFPGPDAK